MILDVGDSVQLPLLIPCSAHAIEPNSETGRSRSLVRKRGTHNQSALLTVLTASSENLNFIFSTHVLMFELFMYVYSCNALSARFFVVDRALNSYFMIMIMIMAPAPLQHQPAASDSPFGKFPTPSQMPADVNNSNLKCE